MDIFEPFQHMRAWDDSGNLYIGSPIVPPGAAPSTKIERNSQEPAEQSRSDQEVSNKTNKQPEKAQRRLAQNREAARKSRMRKKAYVQQLETSRLKLVQLEKELERVRQQGLYASSTSLSGHFKFPGCLNSGIATFEMEYGHWLEEQHRHISELRNALQAHITDVELRVLVENGLNHYNNLFRMKADAAKADVFYLISGKWRTSVERFFHWIGGFSPSELLNILMSHLEPLTDQQLVDVCNLRQSCQQAEDALSQGIDKLQQNLAQSMAVDQMSTEIYTVQMFAAVEKLEALEGFVNQADHVRQQTLQHLSRVLTTRQAARGLLALGEYFHRLRALSSLWVARPYKPV